MAVMWSRFPFPALIVFTMTSLILSMTTKSIHATQLSAIAIANVSETTSINKNRNRTLTTVPGNVSIPLSHPQYPLLSPTPEPNVNQSNVSDINPLDLSLRSPAAETPINPFPFQSPVILPKAMRRMNRICRFTSESTSKPDPKTVSDDVLFCMNALRKIQSSPSNLTNPIITANISKAIYLLKYDDFFKAKLLISSIFANHLSVRDGDYKFAVKLYQYTKRSPLCFQSDLNVICRLFLQRILRNLNFESNSNAMNGMNESVGFHPYHLRMLIIRWYYARTLVHLKREHDAITEYRMITHYDYTNEDHAIRIGLFAEFHKLKPLLSPELIYKEWDKFLMQKLSRYFEMQWKSCIEYANLLIRMKQKSAYDDTQELYRWAIHRIKFNRPIVLGEKYYNGVFKWIAEHVDGDEYRKILEAFRMHYPFDQDFLRIYHRQKHQDRISRLASFTFRDMSGVFRDLDVSLSELQRKESVVESPSELSGSLVSPPDLFSPLPESDVGD